MLQTNDIPKPRKQESQAVETAKPGNSQVTASLVEEETVYENTASAVTDVRVSELHRVIQSEKKTHPHSPFKIEFNVSSSHLSFTCLFSLFTH